MPLTAFSPPGLVAELTPQGAVAWSRDVDTTFGTLTSDGMHPQFFNPLGATFAADSTAKVMRWGAFPRKLARQPSPLRWEAAEQRNRQEEYCEWAAERDRKGRIVRAYFTTEVPSYYHRLANDNPTALLKVYRDHISNDVQPRDLLTSTGAYIADNPWNRRGAMHMIQGSNTLSAAIILVAQATDVRTGESGVITNANDLIRCGVNADAERNSDPLIVGDVNTLARTGAHVTLADPIGLYLDGLQTSGWRTPDGSDPDSYWSITRGENNHAVRGVYTVPTEAGFTVSEITINGQPITSPSQIAEHLQIKITGTAHKIGTNPPSTRPCDTSRGDGLESLAAETEETPTMDELIKNARDRRG